MYLKLTIVPLWRRLLASILMAGVSQAATAAEYIVDNASPTGVTLTGTWKVSAGATGFYGANFLHDDIPGTPGVPKPGGKSVRFTPTLAAAGTYQVYARWASHENRASNTPIDINYSGGTDRVQVNQRTGGGQWHLLGTYPFAAGTTGNVVIANVGTDGYVVADAIRFVSADAPANLAMDGFGVNTGTISPQLTATDWSRMQQAGVRYIRADLTWRTIDKNDGEYNWSTFDKIAQDALNHGIKVVWILCYGNPAYGEPDKAVITPAGRIAFAAYAKAAVARYRQPGTLWEIWNEPNAGHWATETTANNPDQYMDLVDVTVPKMREAGPCYIISGGSNYLDNDKDFLPWFDRCFARGLLTKVDALGVHLYGSTAQNPWAERIGGEVADMRRRMTAAGAPPNFPLLNTEYGNTPESYNAAADAPVRTMDQKLRMQASNVIRSHMLCKLHNVPLNIWYSWRNDNYGLLSDTAVVRPGYNAVVTMNTQLSGYSLEKRVSLGGSLHDVYALLFKNGNNRKLVIWGSRFSQEVTIPVAGSGATIATADLLGVAGTVPVSAGKMVIPVTTDPLYLNLVTATVSDIPDLRFETEYLTSATATDKHLVTSDYIASNSSLYKLYGNAVGDYVQYTVSLPAGNYRMKVRYKTDGARGRFQTYINNQPFGSVIDQYLSSQQYRITDLGPITVNTPGPHVVKFQVAGATGSVYHLTFDYFEFVSVNGSQLWEAESTTRQGTDTLSDFFDFEASGAGGAKVASNLPGDWIEFTGPLSPGTYRVKLRLKEANTRGIFQLGIREGGQTTFQNFGSPVDAYAPANTFTVFDLGSRNFTIGGNVTFRFTITGKTGASTGHDLAVDSIELIK